jgi:hypothetical protein
MKPEIYKFDNNVTQFLHSPRPFHYIGINPLLLRCTLNVDLLHGSIRLFQQSEQKDKLIQIFSIMDMHL